MLNYKLRAFWKRRKETINACGDRLIWFLTALSACDAIFSRWYKLGLSRSKALHAEIDFGNRESLIDLLEKGRHRKDVGKQVMEELRLDVGMSNGGSPAQSDGLSLSC